MVADVITPGITDAETAVAANLGPIGLGGIFGCPSSHEESSTMIESLKLFLPYFPLHIQRLISMYLKMLEFMHTFEMIQNMINHMDEYQALFKMFENTGTNNSFVNSAGTSFEAMTSIFGNTMPDIDSIKNMMKGGDLIDEFTYVEEPPCSGRDGS